MAKVRLFGRNVNNDINIVLIIPPYYLVREVLAALRGWAVWAVFAVVYTGVRAVATER